MNGVLSFLSGLIALVMLFMKRSEDNKHEREALKKEVDNAVDSGDLARINAIIGHINRMR